MLNGQYKLLYISYGSSMCACARGLSSKHTDEPYTNNSYACFGVKFTIAPLILLGVV